MPGKYGKRSGYAAFIGYKIGERHRRRGGRRLTFDEATIVYDPCWQALPAREKQEWKEGGPEYAVAAANAAGRRAEPTTSEELRVASGRHRDQYLAQQQRHRALDKALCAKSERRAERERSWATVLKERRAFGDILDNKWFFTAADPPADHLEFVHSRAEQKVRFFNALMQWASLSNSLLSSESRRRSALTAPLESFATVLAYETSAAPIGCAPVEVCRVTFTMAGGPTFVRRMHVPVGVYTCEHAEHMRRADVKRDIAERARWHALHVVTPGKCGQQFEEWLCKKMYETTTWSNVLRDERRCVGHAKQMPFFGDEPQLAGFWLVPLAQLNVARAVCMQFAGVFRSLAGRGSVWSSCGNALLRCVPPPHNVIAFEDALDTMCAFVHERTLDDPSSGTACSSYVGLPMDVAHWCSSSMSTGPLPQLSGANMCYSHECIAHSTQHCDTVPQCAQDMAHRYIYASMQCASAQLHDSAPLGNVPAHCANDSGKTACALSPYELPLPQHWPPVDARDPDEQRVLAAQSVYRNRPQLLADEQQQVDQAYRKSECARRLMRECCARLEECERCERHMRAEVDSLRRDAGDMAAARHRLMRHVRRKVRAQGEGAEMAEEEFENAVNEQFEFWWRARCAKIASLRLSEGGQAADALPSSSSAAPLHGGQSECDTAGDEAACACAPHGGEGDAGSSAGTEWFSAASDA